jgi:hypothetical protein
MNIESAARRRSTPTESEPEHGHDEIDDHENKNKSVTNAAGDLPKKNGIVKKISQNGNLGNGNSVIEKESLILVPDNTITTNVNQCKEKESPESQPAQSNDNNEVKS